MTTTAATSPLDRARENAERARLAAETQRNRLAAASARARQKVLSGMVRGDGRSARMGISSYPHLKRTRVRVGTAPMSGQGDFHFDGVTHDVARRETQHLLRTNRIAAGMISRLVRGINGKNGPRLQFATPDKEWNKAAERWWARWWKKPEARGMHSGARMCGAIIHGVATDGDIGVIKLADGRVQVIESERIRYGATPSSVAGGGTGGGTDADGTQIIDGIRVDRLGRPLAYSVARIGSMGRPTGEPFWVSAQDMWFLANPIGRRISQTRGEPALHRCIPAFEDINETCGGIRAAIRIAAYAALVIETENPAEMQASMPGEEATAENGISGATQQEQSWSQGSILHLAKGEKVTQVKPEQPHQNVVDYLRMELRMIGADIGLPLEFILLDFSQANFYSGRAAMVLAWEGFFEWQEWFSSFLSELCIWRLTKAIEAGELEAPAGGMDDLELHQFVMGTMPAIDEKQEAEGKNVAVAGGLKSRRQAIEEMGADPDIVESQRLEEMTRDREQGTEPALPAGMNLPQKKASGTGHQASGEDKEAAPV